MGRKTSLSVKIVFDIVMFAALILLYKAKVLTLAYHEIMGLAIMLFFLVHCLFNGKWVVDKGRNLFNPRTPARTKFSYWIAILLVVCFVLIVVSGIFISKILFKEAIAGLGIQDMSVFRTVHLFCSALSLVLIGIHLGLYWNMVKSFFSQRLRLPSKIGKPIAYVLLAAVLACGAYSIPTTKFASWAVSPFVQQERGGHEHGKDRAQGEGARGSDSPESGKSPSSSSGHGSEKADHADPSGSGSQGDADGKSQQSGGSNHGNVVTLPNIASTIIQFTSIVGVFAALTYWVDGALRRKGRRGVRRSGE